MIPAPAECFRLMYHYEMLPNIQAHSLVVAKIAEMLALALRASGVTIDVELTVASALLHDIGKSFCLDNDRNHAALGQDICLAHNFHELAPIVAQHVVLDAESFPLGPLSAKEVVYYADKRVNHDQIVTLEERLLYILARYGQNDPLRHESIRKNFLSCQAIQQAIFQNLGFAPTDLAERMATSSPAWAASITGRDHDYCGGGLCL